MKYIHMLPFLDEEDLDELVEKILSGELKGVKLMMLYPFLSRESLNKLIDHLITENKVKDLVIALPFVSKDKINKIYDAAQAGTITDLNVDSLMPFLGRSKIKELFNKLVKEASELDEDDEEIEIDEEE